MLSKKKIEEFKKRLEREFSNLEKDLESVGRRNPERLGDWEPTAAKMNVGGASDRNDLADTFEELENRASVQSSLEERLNFVKEALDRIKKGKYGICYICGGSIKEQRLEANPAARDCMEHADKT